MRTFVLCFAIVACGAISANAITLEEAQAEAHAWTIARAEIIQDRVIECISEGNPRLCHTAWAASATPNTAPADSSLATVTLDDPGRLVTGPCDTCYIDQGKFSQAGINIPATAPINAKINIAKSPGGWGAQLVIRIRYDGVLYERGYGKGIFDGFSWREVEE